MLRRVISNVSLLRSCPRAFIDNRLQSRCSATFGKDDGIFLPELCTGNHDLFSSRVVVDRRSELYLFSPSLTTHPLCFVDLDGEMRVSSKAVFKKYLISLLPELFSESSSLPKEDSALIIDLLIFLHSGPPKDFFWNSQDDRKTELPTYGDYYAYIGSLLDLNFKKGFSEIFLVVDKTERIFKGKRAIQAIRDRKRTEMVHKLEQKASSTRLAKELEEISQKHEKTTAESEFDEELAELESNQERRTLDSDIDDETPELKSNQEQKILESDIGDEIPELKSTQEQTAKDPELLKPLLDINPLDCFNFSSPLPSSWDAALGNRKWKQNLVHALGYYLREHYRPPGSHDALILAGFIPFSDTALEAYDVPELITRQTERPSPLTFFQAKYGEADMGLWWIASRTTKKHIRIMSSDTDVWVLGLMHSPSFIFSDKTIEVCLSMKFLNSPSWTSKKNERYHVHLSKKRIFDMSLSNLSLSRRRLDDLVAIYLVSGCDFLPRFHRLGKKTFLNVYIKHNDFISNVGKIPLIKRWTPEEYEGVNRGKETIPLEESNVLLKLIGCVYFEKHKKHGKWKTPEELFEICNEDVGEWLNQIRIMSEHHEDKAMHLAYYVHLLFHSQIALFVFNFWNQALQQDQCGLLAEHFAWK